MKKFLFITLLFSSFAFYANASLKMDILYRKAKQYNEALWQDSAIVKLPFKMDKNDYEFYFKHLYDTYDYVYKQGGPVELMMDLDHKMTECMTFMKVGKIHVKEGKYAKLKTKVENRIVYLNTTSSNESLQAKIKSLEQEVEALKRKLAECQSAK